MYPHKLKRRSVAEAHRHLGRSDDIREHNSTQPGIHLQGNRTRGRDFTIAPRDAPAQRSPRLAHRPGRIGAALVVEPIGHILDPVSVLDLEVFAMCFGNVLGTHAAYAVPGTAEIGAERSIARRLS
jgi:hypothetical protein